ncbi:MAG: family 10 glycosylhydrolase [Saprospiraceae bacterium]|nr:family 10 glycosylhydrolase [Saprospiraceae bacterium]
MITFRPFYGLVFLFALALNLNLNAQDAPVAEMRGAWIATVANIDWPSKPGLTPDQQKIEFDSILDVLKAMNMNAVFVQVRPAGDAFYKSASIPWSKYLTGKQGVAPGDSTYDPLVHMIKAAHERRMEFHAWLNPYRATSDLDTASLDARHPLRALPAERKRQWFFRYGNKYYFNPASPLVQQYLTNVVKDLVIRYDVDGIHFDDYFYPYKETGQNLDDYNEFAADPRNFTNVEDWRRDNINRLIQGVSTTIKKTKPYVKFGIGPFGVWRNRDRDPINGSDTRAGITCYDDLYADVLLWMRNGWIDYVAPQLYWSIGFAPADYQKLVEWWGKNTYGRQLYIGHAAYKINNAANDPNWNKPDEISRQIAMNRSNAAVNGSIFFSTKSLLRNPNGIQDTLIGRVYANQALVPGIPSLASAPPATPQICRVDGDENAVKLTWNICELLSGEESPYYFGIYRFEGEKIGEFKDPRNLLNITAFDNEKWYYEDQTAIPGEYYTYVVRAFNRANVESYSSEPVFVKKTQKKAKKKRKFWGYLFG